MLHLVPRTPCCAHPRYDDSVSYIEPHKWMVRGPSALLPAALHLLEQGDMAAQTRT